MVGVISRNIRMKTTTPALFLSMLALLSGPALAQSDNFNDGNDTGWTRFNPIGTASFSFPAGGYRLATVASPNPATLGPGRGGSLRQDVLYTKLSVSVDIVEWNAAEDASWAAPATPAPGPGALNGYAATFNTLGRGIGH